MTEIRPFSALHYPFDHPDFSKLIAPPYDVISEEKRKELLTRHPQNCIRLILGDPKDKNRYHLSEEVLEEWNSKKVLVLDPKPSLFILQDHFTWGDRKWIRSGILSTVRLQDYSFGGILPHERTLEAPIEDRYRLMSELKMNESPVYFICRDRNKTFEKHLSQFTTSPPLLQIQNEDEPIVHKIWKIYEPKQMEQLQNSLKSEQLLIADGHHRYATSLRYSKSNPGKGTDWVLGFIASGDPENVALGSIHRLVTTPISPEKIILKLKSQYYIKPGTPSWDSFISSEAPLAMIDIKGMSLIFQKAKSEGLYDNLPSVILNDQILKPILEVDTVKPTDQKKIDFF
jgi:uncharacterized protein (DUF1015 family)